jgi:uncharacterized oxidoreductase
MKSSGNTILVTGGGSGIGREYARRWHDAGNTVIVVGRTLSSLEETAQDRDNIHPVEFDVADAQGVAAFAAQLCERFPRLNVVVNNAGIMPFETIEAPRDLGDAERVVETNLLGPIRLIDAFIEQLKAAEDAALINVSSGLAFVPLPKAATYSASKAALHSYTLSLRKRLEGLVEVIELIPPGVQTELTPGQSQLEGYLPLDDFISESMELLAQKPTPSEICVEAVRAFRNSEANGNQQELLDMLGAR